MSGERFGPTSAPLGPGILQGNTSKVPNNPAGAREGGAWNLRGVVIQIFPRDRPPPNRGVPASSYCSVLAYSPRRVFFPCVQMTQPVGGSPFSGVLGGGIRGSSMTSEGLSSIEAAIPAALDGSHVVLSFFDNDFSQPYVSAILEHPRADGKTDLAFPAPNDQNKRLRLCRSDILPEATTTGINPLLYHWNGISFGVLGPDFFIDLTRAYDGVLGPGATEPPPTTDSDLTSRGRFRVNLPNNGRITVRCNGQDALVLHQNNRLKLGDGAHHVADGERLEAKWNELIHWLNNVLVLQTNFGPTLTAAASETPAAPAWDDKIVNDKLEIPDHE